MLRLLLVVAVVVALAGAGVAAAMLADVTDPACEVVTHDVHLQNGASGQADVDIYSEGACGQ